MWLTDELPGGRRRLHSWFTLGGGIDGKRRSIRSSSNSKKAADDRLARPAGSMSTVSNPAALATVACLHRASTKCCRRHAGLVRGPCANSLTRGKEASMEARRTPSRFHRDLRPQGNITGLTGLMDFKDNGSNAHVQFEILGSSFSETFGKDIKRVSSHRFTSGALRRKSGDAADAAGRRWRRRQSLNFLKEVCCRLAFRLCPAFGISLGCVVIWSAA